MRAWIYDTLTHDQDLINALGPDGATSAQDAILYRVMPRQSQETINTLKPFLVYGLGNDTNEDLSEDPEFEINRQFFEVWIHDEGGDYGKIDDIIPIVKRALVGKNAPAFHITTVRWLETSAEFNNKTYNTIFRYIRFQAIISKGVTIQ